MDTEIRDMIYDLKKRKNAVILAHYYAPSEVQAVADYVGDSFYLAKVAKQSDAKIIVFCGVRFMGESAKILNPDKKVIMPDISADCAMAHMVKDGIIEKMREEYDDLKPILLRIINLMQGKSGVSQSSINVLMNMYQNTNKENNK